MSVIGIVSVPKKNKSIKERILGSPKIKESFGDNPKYIALELPYCKEQLRLMKSRKIKKLLKRAEGVLRISGADRVVHTQECKEIFACEIGDGRVFVPPQKIGECVLFMHKKIMEENNKTTFNSLVIHDSRLAAVSYKMLAELCRHFKNIRLQTERLDEANKICDKAFADYGICISVAGANEKKAASRRYIFADVDAGRVCAGDFVINGIEILTDTREYNVDGYDITCAILKDDKAEVEVKNYLSGKNKLKKRLTIND